MFFLPDTATASIYSLSLHDALPISRVVGGGQVKRFSLDFCEKNALHVPLAAIGTTILSRPAVRAARDRKSTRLNSSHQIISYAVFCLKKKKKKQTQLANQGQYGSSA